MFALPFIGCSDLEEKPSSILAPESFIKSAADIQAIVNGSYGLMTSERYWGRALSATLLLRDDMATIGVTAAVERISMDNFTDDDSNALVYGSDSNPATPRGFYAQSYQIIAATNHAIEGAKLLTNESPQKLNPIVAEARFYRAFTTYNLVRLFGDIPYIDYVVTDPGAVSSLTKTKEADVYKVIIADLEFAKENLPVRSDKRAKPSKSTAAAYLASVYLTLKEYEKSYNEAKYVITNKAAANIDLEADFQNLFDASKSATLKEPLFTIDYNNQSSGADRGQGKEYLAFLTGIARDFTYIDAGALSVIVPTKKVFDDWNEKDYRRAVSFDTVYRTSRTGTPINISAITGSGTVNRPHIAKFSRFAGRTGLNLRDSQNNYAMMRYAELLLIAAEALNETKPGSTEALGYLNEVRKRARNRKGVQKNFPADIAIGLSKDDFRNAVIEERRLELAFEGVRWFDIKRLDLGEKVFGSTGFEPQTGFNKSKYFLRLPLIDVISNPNLQ